jgi:Leucine-rich repeat (LRR) protein
LKKLFCNYNNLTELPSLDNLSNLEILNCGDNELTTLPNLSNSTKLKRVIIWRNEITSLPDLSNIIDGLSQLAITGNKLPYKDKEGYKKWYNKHSK